jgi:hypothetical protein
MTNILSPLIKQFLPFAKERMGFKKPPRLFLRSDTKNAGNPLGKTAFYDPQAKSVTLYITNRHPKDIMRSLSHELVHHTQNCNGEFDNVGEMGEGYAQNNDHLREMERQAYEMGNLCFRDWEDSIKSTIYSEHLQKGVNKAMSTKLWKDKELSSLLSEAWGFGFDLGKLNENETEELEEEKEELEEMCPAVIDAEAPEMVVGHEDDMAAEAPEGRAVELVDELRDLIVQITGEEDEMEEEPIMAPMQEAKLRALIRKTLKNKFKK